MIPQKQKKIINNDEWFSKCIFCGNSHVQQHHALRYGKKNIPFITVPCCKMHHDIIHKQRLKEFVEKARWVAISRIGVDYLQANYPKFDWSFELDRLNQIYGGWE